MDELSAFAKRLMKEKSVGSYNINIEGLVELFGGSTLFQHNTEERCGTPSFCQESILKTAKNEHLQERLILENLTCTK